MARIFLALALLAVALLAGNLLLALAIGDFGAKSRAFATARRQLEASRIAPELSPPRIDAERAKLRAAATALRRQRDRFWPHVWLGIVASLVALLVNSISITYFIGTSRWCREVTEAYGMKQMLVLRSNRLKKRAFAWALIGIACTLLIAAFGAAADPYSSSTDPAGWVTWHWISAISGFAIIAASFHAQYQTVNDNQEMIQEVLDETARIRGSERCEE